ncbi:VOC family protein [Streptomycetaceae bacterium NBC_01309]
MTNTADKTAINGLYPRLVVSDGPRALDFYRTAFGAEEVERYTDPEGRIVHAMLRIGGVPVAVKDEGDGDPAPTTLGGSPVIIALDVADADATADAMVRGGATVVYPVADQPYGQRGGRLADPFGHLWMVSQTTEELTPEEIQERTTRMHT